VRLVLDSMMMRCAPGSQHKDCRMRSTNVPFGAPIFCLAHVNVSCGMELTSDQDCTFACMNDIPNKII
jgi:hypothetical protein